MKLKCLNVKTFEKFLNNIYISNDKFNIYPLWHALNILIKYLDNDNKDDISLLLNTSDIDLCQCIAFTIPRISGTIILIPVPDGNGYKYDIKYMPNVLLIKETPRDVISITYFINDEKIFNYTSNILNTVVEYTGDLASVCSFGLTTLFSVLAELCFNITWVIIHYPSDNDITENDDNDSQEEKSS